MLYLKGRNQKLISSEAQCSGHQPESVSHSNAVCCHEFWGGMTEMNESMLANSQCYSSRPNVHFKPWKGVQSVGYFWRLEGRRALTGATCVVFCKWMKGLKKCRDKTMRSWTCDVIPIKNKISKQHNLNNIQQWHQSYKSDSAPVTNLIISVC